VSGRGIKLGEEERKQARGGEKGFQASGSHLADGS